MSTSENPSKVSPRVFVSYSWSSEDHKDRVRLLVDRLIGDGVDVLLDVYDLREGDDRFVYMERSVTDPSVTKVIAITDRAYKEKMDGRKGGVGIEGTIMSAKVYQQVSGENNKFVAVVFETELDGKASLPAMFDSKFYIDMTTDELLEANYEQLVRFLYNKPLRKKPVLGRQPGYLLEDDRPQLMTLGKAAAVRDAVTRDRMLMARGLLADYLDALESVLTATTPAVKDRRHADLEVGRREIARFVTYRNEFVQLLQFLVRHGNLVALEVVELLAKFFERGMGLAERLGKGVDMRALVFGHVQFAVHELFVYAVGLLWKGNKVDDAIRLLVEPYFVDFDDGAGPRYATYGSISVPLELFENGGYSSGRQAGLMREHANSGVLTWSEVCEVDAILWLRTIMSEGQQKWYPRTVSLWKEGAFPSFARAESQRNVAPLVRILGVEEATLTPRLKAVCASSRDLLGFMSHTAELATCFNLMRLGSRP